MKFICKFHSEPEQQQYTTVLDDNSIIKRIFIDKQSLKKGFVQILIMHNFELQNMRQMRAPLEIAR